MRRSDKAEIYKGETAVSKIPRTFNNNINPVKQTVKSQLTATRRLTRFVKTNGFLYFFPASFIVTNKHNTDIRTSAGRPAPNFVIENISRKIAVRREKLVESPDFLTQRIYRSDRYEFCWNIIISRLNSKKSRIKSSRMVIIDIIAKIFIMKCLYTYNHFWELRKEASTAANRPGSSKKL